MLVMRKLGAGIAVATLLVAGFTSDAMALPPSLSWRVRTPYCAVPESFPPLTQLWLGHFSGGRDISSPQPLPNVEWQEQYACFTSRAECQSWQRTLHGQFRRYAGYKTCLPIR